MLTTTFINVRISVDAPDPKTAYTRLCNALASIEAEWDTDMYCVYDPETNKETEFSDTEELFPSEEGGN